MIKIDEYLFAWIFLALISTGYIVAITKNIVSGIKNWKHLHFNRNADRYFNHREFHS